MLYAKGCDIDTNDTSAIPAAVAAAAVADVVVFVGGLITCQEIGPECQEAEARDRSTPVGVGTDVGRDVGIGLPGNQLATLQSEPARNVCNVCVTALQGEARGSRARALSTGSRSPSGRFLLHPGLAGNGVTV